MRIQQRGKRLVRPVIIGLALSFAPAVAAVPAVSATSATATSCAEEWGSLVKQRSSYSLKQITDVRSGQHACYDRLVIDINGEGRGKPGYYVQYHRVVMDGSGIRVPLRGGADISILVNAPAYDDDGLTYQPQRWRELVDVSGYRTFRQVAWAGSFEGYTTIGLGVRARLPMRVFTLAGPVGGHRLVIDVAHDW